MRELKIFFATHNLDKKREIEYILTSKKIKVLYIEDFPDYPEVEETGKTLEENSIIKVLNGYSFTKLDTFAEDTGLFVESLNGEPGVFTSRYAGKNPSYQDNYMLLLKKMEDFKEDFKRKAYFKTVITFKTSEFMKQFEGVCEGRIAYRPEGEKGFGYDPVFIPDGFDKTFAQLDESEKNRISHRAKAVNKFIDFLEKEYLGA
jgi:XTP/dITP diphosphohydrolase